MVDQLPTTGRIEDFTGRVWWADAMDLLAALPDASVDLILTDFPYNTLKHLEWDKRAIDIQAWWKHAMRVIKPKSAIISTASQPFTSVLVSSNYSWFRCEWIWEKDAGTGYLNANRQPMKSHESVLVFAKGSHRYYPQMEKGEAYSATRGAVGGFVRDKTVGGYATQNEGLRYPKSIIRFSSDKGIHPTQKPVSLFEFFLNSYSLQGDIVLDCFSGSGTTAIACLNLDRRYICADLHEPYVIASRERIQRHDPFTASPLANGLKQRSLFE